MANIDDVLDEIQDLIDDVIEDDTISGSSKQNFLDELLDLVKKAERNF